MAISNINLLGDNNCIAAIATGMTDAGIGIVRVSGKDSIKLLAPFFSDIDLLSCKSHTIHYGHFSYKGEVIDEVMVSIFLAPRSYTKENVVEINCHGGMFILQKVLETILTTDIRLAEPGEFTKRAFLNGRIDLSQSEAVMDLINSNNDFSRRASLQHLKGNLSEKIKAIRNKLIRECAFIEAALDDPENYSLEDYDKKLFSIITEIKDELLSMKNNFNEGSIMKYGINTVIIGKPNVGKSSLLNMLSGDEYAIVTEIPGTTRDIISNQINFNGLPLNLIDTAGIRETDDVVEKIGVKKSLSYINKADLIILMLDNNSNISEEDIDIFKHILEIKTQIITVINKSDLQKNLNVDKIPKKLKENLISISILNNEGKEQISKKIKDIFFSGKLVNPSEVLISNRRQLQEIDNAIRSIDFCIKTIEDKMTEDLYTIDLMDAYTSLGRIIGESVEDDLVNKIFSEFCMGK